jgi:chromosome partitioning protein
MPSVTTIANDKGGVGKTFLTQLLAAEMAMRGRRVLVVDLDPQGNLSRRLGYPKAVIADRITVSEAVRDASPDVLAASILPCQWEPDWAGHIYVVPARKELEQRSTEAGTPASWTRLTRALHGVADDYDDVLIDTPPQLGHLLHLALRASQHIVVPAAPETDSIQGIYALSEFLADPDGGQALGIAAEIAGIVVNGKRAGVATHEQRTQEIVTTWGPLVWQPPMPLRAKAQDSASEYAEPVQHASAEIRDIASQLGDAYVKAVTA